MKDNPSRKPLKDSILELKSSGKMSQSDIARCLGCSNAYVSQVVHSLDRKKERIIQEMELLSLANPSLISDIIRHFSANGTHPRPFDFTCDVCGKPIYPGDARASFRIDKTLYHVCKTCINSNTIVVPGKEE